MIIFLTDGYYNKKEKAFVLRISFSSRFGTMSLFAFIICSVFSLCLALLRNASIMYNIIMKRTGACEAAVGVNHLVIAIEQSFADFAFNPRPPFLVT